MGFWSSLLNLPKGSTCKFWVLERSVNGERVASSVHKVYIAMVSDQSELKKLWRELFFADFAGMGRIMDFTEPAGQQWPGCTLRSPRERCERWVFEFGGVLRGGIRVHGWRWLRVPSRRRPMREITERLLLKRALAQTVLTLISLWTSRKMNARGWARNWQCGALAEPASTQQGDSTQRAVDRDGDVERHSHVMIAFLPWDTRTLCRGVKWCLLGEALACSRRFWAPRARISDWCCWDDKFERSVSRDDGTSMGLRVPRGCLQLLFEFSHQTAWTAPEFCKCCVSARSAACCVSGVPFARKGGQMVAVPREPRAPLIYCKSRGVLLVVTCSRVASVLSSQRW